MIKRKRNLMLLAAACLSVILSGCGENTDAFDQAGKDLEQGSFSYALSGYQESISQGIQVERSYRGAGIACLRMAEYGQAADYFTKALACEDVKKGLRKDILSYRASTYYKAGDYDKAMADCQLLMQEFGRDAENTFLTGSVALSMDAYEEAEREFDNSYSADPSYANSIRIYQEYLAKGMEADGTKYLEKAVADNRENSGNVCDRARIYYYMEDYEKAAQELTREASEDNTEAMLLLGMIYMARNDASNARAMYQQYVNAEPKRAAKGYNGLALCDMQEGKYDAALVNLEQGIATATTEEMQSILFNQIVIYEKKLDFVSAKEKAQEYLDMFPEDREASRELTFLKSRTLSS